MVFFLFILASLRIAHPIYDIVDRGALCAKTYEDQNQLAFSISRLKLLLALHLTPINRVIFPRPNGEYSS